MFKVILSTIIFSLLSVSVYSQSLNDNIINIEISKIEKLLIGDWKFVKTIDSNNKEVKRILKDYKFADGSDIIISADGPDLSFSSDRTYTKIFTKKNSDKGFWRLIEKNKIAYKLLTLKNSENGTMISQAEGKMKVKWEVDENGNYVDTVTDEIILINEKELRIKYEKKYVLIYSKKN